MVTRLPQGNSGHGPAKVARGCSSMAAGVITVFGAALALLWALVG
jgi:hypothetical protein